MISHIHVLSGNAVGTTFRTFLGFNTSHCLLSLWASHQPLQWGLHHWLHSCFLLCPSCTDFNTVSKMILENLSHNVTLYKPFNDRISFTLKPVSLWECLWWSLSELWTWCSHAQWLPSLLSPLAHRQPPASRHKGPPSAFLQLSAYLLLCLLLVFTQWLLSKCGLLRTFYFKLQPAPTLPTTLPQQPSLIPHNLLNFSFLNTEIVPFQLPFFTYLLCLFFYFPSTLFSINIY